MISNPATVADENGAASGRVTLARQGEEPGPFHPKGPAGQPNKRSRGVCSMTLDRDQILAIQAQINSLRNVADDCLVISVGARGPNLDMPEGNAVATVRMGDDEARAEAKYLDDAITLARAKIIRARDAREKERAKKRGEA